MALTLAIGRTPGALTGSQEQLNVAVVKAAVEMRTHGTLDRLINNG